MFKYWYERLKEVRELGGYEPKEFSAKTGIPYTVLNRYEKGRGPELMSGRLKLKLRKVLTEDDITYIEKGDEDTRAHVVQIGSGINQSSGRDSVVSGRRGNKENTEGNINLDDPNIASIIDTLPALNKAQIRKVLFLALSLEKKNG